MSPPRRSGTRAVQPDAPAKPGRTIPCPGCGRPVEAAAESCIRCCRRLRGDGELSTRMDRAQMLRPPRSEATVGEQMWREDQRRMLVKSLVWFGIALIGLVAMRTYEGGWQQTLLLLYREGVTLALALPLLWLARMTVVDAEAGLVVSLAGLAAALQVWDLGQEVVRQFYMPTLAWVVGLFLCVGLLADLLDLEIVEALFVSVALLLLKLILRWTLFAPMFA